MAGLKGCFPVSSLASLRKARSSSSSFVVVCSKRGLASDHAYMLAVPNACRYTTQQVSGLALTHSKANTTEWSFLALGRDAAMVALKGYFPVSSLAPHRNTRSSSSSFVVVCSKRELASDHACMLAVPNACRYTTPQVSGLALTHSKANTTEWSFLALGRDAAMVALKGYFPVSSLAPHQKTRSSISSVVVVCSKRGLASDYACMLAVPNAYRYTTQQVSGLALSHSKANTTEWSFLALGRDVAMVALRGYIPVFSLAPLRKARSFSSSIIVVCSKRRLASDHACMLAVPNAYRCTTQKVP